ncbi:hypothetical protein [Spiroplasma sp. SV19]|uniref:hypothetical protein n=1 Tax=Spiroplasma sp. SV19 TaxID=2570468 RepID=UPI0024B664B5|nr:hypothetical protein [Spiroplasma sp. SV19]WHQ36848.1 hypothetical protein E7Y35_02955 [Spiroplasma sp. SV19]
MFKWNNKILFYVRLGALLAILSFLIADLVLTIVDPQPQFKELGYAERVSNYYAFFTTQTNYIVAMYFFAYLFEGKFANCKPSYLIKLAVTTYITVTMLVFWLGIFTNTQDSNQYDAFSWASTIVLHLVIPVSMIISYILTSGNFKYDIKKHYKLALWLILIYPVSYFIIILIRGALRHLDHRPANTWYPYFFLNVYQEWGWLILIFAFVCILSLFIGLQYLYIFLNNKLYHKYHGETLNKRVNEKVFGIKENSVTLQNKDVFIPQTLLNIFYR